jgi:hypothetical protein
MVVPLVVVGVDGAVPVMGTVVVIGAAVVTGVVGVMGTAVVVVVTWTHAMIPTVIYVQIIEE